MNFINLTIGHGRIVEEHINEWLFQFENQQTARIQRAKVDKEFENLKVGDWLECQFNEYGDCLPLRVEGRHSQMIRRSNQGEEQIIGVNLDYVFIVTSANHDFNINRLRRFVALALSGKVQPVILLSKIDLVADPMPMIAEIKSHFEGLNVIGFSATQNSGLGELQKYFEARRTIAVVGSSGVGKSTLINKLLDENRQFTGEIREGDSKGKHTTTSRSLILMRNGSWLMDTPGMRQVGLIDSEDGLAELFEDIYRLFLQCKFSDCQHLGEPHCAVQAALEVGTLDFDRWQEFVKFEKENRSRKRRNPKTTEYREEKRWMKGISKAMRDFKKR